ncbi:hypothetical protein [Rhizobacter sp. Root404]|jgi:hypothetical protein|uniref:hypothetical protein n=1 Tax=Rhizobacter sp. Root404 TaxID=1736528 RepID=UPI0007012363|nr:hypothetical protein [Rhizobacter sp. Root404]KQW35571.1 hypothetical protein ASC76_21425 [Rhizobacter sp. Root404]
MNPVVGWALAFIALVAGWFSYGWPGIALAFSVIVFWLLIQFNRSVRVMRDASEAPVGHVPSAVMLHSKLSVGQPMLQIVRMTKSLGRRVSESPEIWSWTDDSGADVRITFDKGVCASWTLDRPG